MGIAPQLHETHQPSPKALEERAAAAGLICNFLVAIEQEGGPRSPFMTFAQGLALKQLDAWGIAR